MFTVLSSTYPPPPPPRIDMWHKSEAGMHSESLTAVLVTPSLFMNPKSTPSYLQGKGEGGGVLDPLQELGDGTERTRVEY